MERVSTESAFGRALEARREVINAQFLMARREHRRLDGDVYLDALARWVGPVVEAAAALEPARAGVVLDAAAAASLELVARGYMGEHARTPLVHKLWEQGLPQLGRFVAAEPARVIHALTNAVVALSAEPQARVFDWMRWLVTLSAECADAGALLEVGKLLAWRVGMAHWRASALEVARTMPGALALKALGCAPGEAQTLEVSAVLDRLAADPWAKPGPQVEGVEPTQLKLMASVGSFRGFGGVFTQPPMVAAGPDGQLYAYSQDGCWSIHVDSFGATLQRDGRELPAEVDEAWGEFKLTAAGRVTWRKLKAELPLLAKSASHAANAHMLAITLHHSHQIYIVGAR